MLTFTWRLSLSLCAAECLIRNSHIVHKQNICFSLFDDERIRMDQLTKIGVKTSKMMVIFKSMLHTYSTYTWPKFAGGRNCLCQLKHLGLGCQILPAYSGWLWMCLCELVTQGLCEPWHAGWPSCGHFPQDQQKIISYEVLVDEKKSVCIIYVV